MENDHPTHPLRGKAHVLLTSVFGPYARDDEYGSRKMNPMELYHNQVTRVQGPFSLRMFHRSFGLMMIQANIDAPCTLLDFPDQDRFVEEISSHAYDVIGISAIMPNILKVRRMCELIREHCPSATIVLGGHIANMPQVRDRVDADHIVRGDGVRWMRNFLGEDPEQPIRHPLAVSAFGARVFGITAPERPGETAALLIPSVGCPVGCNFCSTSAMFGGKGKCVTFYETGDELFNVMCQLEEKLKVRDFFTMDENFLLHKARALRLLELMREHGKTWALYVFSSARVLKSYTIDQLIGLGVSWVWMGLEGKGSQYHKLDGVDTHALVAEMQSHGIRVLGSTIVGLEEHTPENFDAAIEHAVAHNTVFHQFMLYTPIPGTPFYEELRQAGTLLPESAYEHGDIHGQLKFNYRHKNIPEGMETEMILRAFQRDFDVNGPSLMRMFRVTLDGWLRYKNHPETRVRERFAREVAGLRGTYAAAAWATRRYFRRNRDLYERYTKLLKDVYAEFGLKTRLVAPTLGRVCAATIRFEERRLARGWTYEPTTHCEKNAAALALETHLSWRERLRIPEIQWVTAELTPIQETQ
jgi:radical SAM superfamily enzyme YgiQ (UPF0313 family)